MPTLCTNHMWTDSEQDAQSPAPEGTVRAANGERGSWLLFADRGSVAQQLAELLTRRGDTCVLVSPGEGFQQDEEGQFQISPYNPEDMKRLPRAVTTESQPAWRGAIHLWSLDSPPPEGTSLETLQRAEVLGCHCIMYFVQALYNMNRPNQSTRLFLVTRGAQPVGPGNAHLSVSAAPLIGLGRIVASGHPGIRCKTVDLSLASSPAELRSLFAELWTADPEEEIVLRHEDRFVPRLGWPTPPKIPVERDHSGGTGATPFRLEISPSGLIDNLTLHETTRHPPGPGQVEIEVCAASLNFRDVMKALGIYPTDDERDLQLGDECAGRIVAVGPGVEDFEVGDEVIAIAPGSFGAYVTTSAPYVMHRPSELTCDRGRVRGSASGASRDPHA
ncbi:MAG: KR prefix domain-containing protein [Candidatus Entotheonellia bacterium]